MESRRGFLGACAGIVAGALAGCIDFSEDELTITEARIQRDDENKSSDKPQVTANERADDGVSALVVEGAVVGRNGCFDDVSLSSRDVDDSGALELIVNPIQSDSTEGPCTQALVSIGYEATVKYEGTLDQLTVQHGGAESDSYVLIGGDEG